MKKKDKIKMYLDSFRSESKRFFPAHLYFLLPTGNIDAFNFVEYA